jgi:hypothetical protein
MSDELIKKLAHLHSMSIVEVAELARAFLSVEIDPITEKKGDPFVFQRRRERTEPFGSSEEDFDLCWINGEVPEPYAPVNLLDALNEFKSDCERCAMLLKDNLSIERLRAISKNQLAWCRFWAVRHRNEAVRAMFAKRAAEGEALMAKNSERADKHLRERAARRG